MISAPALIRSSEHTALTVPCVPTGINTGVSIPPWGGDNFPRRALELFSFFKTLNLNIVSRQSLVACLKCKIQNRRNTPLGVLFYFFINRSLPTCRQVKTCFYIILILNSITQATCLPLGRKPAATDYYLLSTLLHQTPNFFFTLNS